MSSPDGDAKFWIEPEVRLAVSEGMNTVELHEIQRLIEERKNEIREHWNRHFGR